MLRRVPFFLALLLVGLVLAGCGGSSVSQSDINKINAATDRMQQVTTKLSADIYGCAVKATPQAINQCVDTKLSAMAAQISAVTASYRQAAKDSNSSSCKQALDAQATRLDRAATLLKEVTGAGALKKLQAIGPSVTQGQSAILKGCHLKLKKSS